MRLWLFLIALLSPINLYADAMLDHEAPKLSASPSIGNQKIILDKAVYADQLEGFWLATSIGNWTGLITEMDKIGGEGPHGTFYTRDDWGQPDQPNIWDKGQPSKISPIIDFVLLEPDEIWGADDDTDIEYIYQYYLSQTDKTILSGDDVRQAWITHIYDETKPTPYGPDEDRYQNYLWVSNQQAHSLMLDGMSPPDTSAPIVNPHWDMIDAQLTTEIFGLYAPGHPELALQLAEAPISATARGGAAEAARFYVVMFSLASSPQLRHMDMKSKILWMADQAQSYLPSDSYTSAMYDFVKSGYEAGKPWEQLRDQLYLKYQVHQEDGYDISSRDLYCNGCFAAGINFAASLVSLFYGEGDLKKTIKIGSLAGWDSDNPTATWAGLIGFMMGKAQVEASFGKPLSETFHIHRTRKGFPNDGIDTFSAMAEAGIGIIDNVVTRHLKGQVDPLKNKWVFDHPVLK